MNTKHSGEFNVVIVRDPSKREYVGFCPEFAIVKYGDDFTELKQDLINASKAYVTALAENNLSTDLYNRTGELPEKFQLLYVALLSHIEKKDNEHEVSSRLPKSYRQALITGNATLTPACA